MKKTLKISLGVTLLFILSIIIGIKFLFKPVIESQIRAAGFPKAQVGSASIGLSGTVLKNISLDDAGNHIDEINVYALASDIFAYHVGKIEVTGVTLNWPLNLPPPQPSTTPVNFYTKQIDFRNVTLNIATPFGPLPIGIEGTVLDNGDNYGAAGAAIGEAAFGHVDGKFTLSVDKATHLLKAEYKLGEARLKSADIELRRVTGWVSADIDPKNALPSINAQLVVGGLKAYGVPMQGTNLTISSEKQKIQATLDGQVINDSGNINVDFKLDQSDTAADKVSLKAEAQLKHLDALEAVDMGGQGSLLLNLTGDRNKSSDWADMSQWKTLAGSLGVDMEKLSLPGLLSNAEALASLHLSLDPATGKITATAANGPVSFNGKLRALGNRIAFINIPGNAKNPAAAVWDKTAKTLTATIDGADIAGLDYMAKGISTQLTAYLSDAPVMEGKIDIAELRQNVKLPYFMPVKVALQFQAMNSVKAGTGFSGTISEKNGKFAAKVEGKYDSAKQKGDASLTLPPTSFVQNVTPLGLSFPYSTAYIQDAFGTAGLSASFEFGNGKGGWTASSHGQVFLKDFTCTVKENVISGISTVLNLDSLSPPVLSHQNIAVGALNVGLPLTDGALEVSLDAARNMTLHKAEWNAAGGKISSSAFTMPLDTMTTAVTLSANKLDLQQLFAIAPLDGLTAEGVVNGTLPLTINNGTFLLTNGVLQSGGAGKIRYNPQNPPAFLQNQTSQQIIDLKAALAAFDFDSLRMTIDDELGKSQKISLQISGKNPLFYSGHAVNFNLNVEGPIENIIRYNPGSSRIPDGIRKQLEDFETKHGKT